MDRTERRLPTSTSIEGTLQDGLDAVIQLLGADFGNIQLYRGGSLIIACHRGLNDSFLRAFRLVSVYEDCACGRALRHGRAVIIPDVTTDPEFAPFRTIAAESGFLAVQSTPLITSDGRFVGMISTHFAERHFPSKEDMAVVAQYATQLADAVQSFVSSEFIAR